MTIEYKVDWIKLLGSAYPEKARGVDADNYRFVYLTGSSFDDFEGNENNGSVDIYLAKYGIDGEKIWTKLLGTDLDEEGFSIKVDNSNSIIVSGYTTGDLLSQEGNGSQDVFISKFDADGNLYWSRNFGTWRTERANSLEIDRFGSIYVGGSIDSTTAFVEKVDSEGNSLWKTTYGTSGGFEYLQDIALGSNGEVYITGYTNGNLEGNANNGDYDSFVSKLDNNGNKIWTKLIGTETTDKGWSLNVDSTGNIYITGETNGDLNNNINNGSTDAFLSYIDSSGEIQWTKLFGTDTIDIAYASTLGENSIFISGTTFGDYKEIDNSGSSDIFITEIDSTGSEIWSGLIGSNSNDATYDLSTGLNGDIYFTGDTGGDLYGQENQGLNDGFIGKLILYSNDLAEVNSSYEEDSNGFSSISGSSPVNIIAYELGKETILDSIKDYEGNLHGGDTLDETPSSYKYQGLLDVNGDGVFEGIFTNEVSRRWATAKVDSSTLEIDFSDYGSGGGTRVVGIYEDPLIVEGSSNGGFLSDQITVAPAALGATGSDRYIDLNGDGDFDDANEDRLALNSQVRFQNDLDIDNLIAKHSGDYDSDGVYEVYWKTNDGTAYLRALMHDDGNIRYANYQSEIQMREYLVSQGHTEIISDIV